MRVAEVASHKGLRPTNGRVSGEKVEGTWHFSRVHLLTEDLPSQTKMEASGEGNFSVSMNTSSSAPFQEERLGLGLYIGGGGGGGGCTCKNSNGDAHQIFPD